MRIMLAMTTLTAGGAERVAATMLNYWARMGNQVALVTIYSTQSDFYSLDSSVKRFALGQNRATKNWREFLVDNLKRVKQLRAAIRAFRPEVVVSFLDVTNIRVLLAVVGLHVPVVVEEHIDPTQNPIGKVAACLRRLLYPRARALVVLAPSIVTWARGIVKRESVHVIPNPIGEQFCGQDTHQSKKSHTVVAMGRMEPQKGFDLLLTAFARCAPNHPAWQLRIFGEGSERQRLTKLAGDLGIAERVSLETTIREPERMFRDSSLFVLSSRYEGFPMVLLEAMACGLPVVSFDCRTGPSEMIQNGVNGLLVPPNDTEALAQAMDRLMGSESERVALGSRAAEIADRFSLARVMAMWNELLDNVAGAMQHNASRFASLRSQPFEERQAATDQRSRVASTSLTDTQVESVTGGQ